MTGSCTVAQYKSFSYSIGWVLSEATQWISIVVLLTHFATAVLHTVTIVWTGRSSEAWDLMNELVALAYNPVPVGRVMENCSGGIGLVKTLGKNVKVSTKSVDSERKLEPVILEDKAERYKSSNLGEGVAESRHR
ncbi:hypothetical protein K469DRAFT_710590 [Zopfia rhizophila CBS 207.26]|uniref:Uncharacterized protein n=1 Tax=Zopfia rhizophila CBS 207.26 TaxID=1314779 RepID=A0A6A6DZ16_9PEZI|nr:hypothetical protein K469DRAFT_710590 [Zopfia rhizophila CBS 207.26]